MELVAILGRCSPQGKNNTGADDGCRELEKNDDVVGILRVLKCMAFSQGDVQYPDWTIQDVLRRCAAINQDVEETVADYNTEGVCLLRECWTSNGVCVPLALGEHCY